MRVLSSLTLALVCAFQLGVGLPQLQAQAVTNKQCCPPDDCCKRKRCCDWTCIGIATAAGIASGVIAGLVAADDGKRGPAGPPGPIGPEGPPFVIPTKDATLEVVFQVDPDNSLAASGENRGAFVLCVTLPDQSTITSAPIDLSVPSGPMAIPIFPPVQIGTYHVTFVLIDPGMGNDSIANAGTLTAGVFLNGIKIDEFTNSVELKFLPPPSDLQNNSQECFCFCCDEGIVPSPPSAAPRAA